jgi:acetylxylan esterase
MNITRERERKKRKKKGFLTTPKKTDNEQLKQWSNVLGLTTSKNTTNTPKSGWTQTIYGEGTATSAQLVGYSANGVGHSVPQQEAMDLAFFGIA